MSQAIENSMVNDRCWPEQKPQSVEERIDELTRDAMFRGWDWTDEIGMSELQEIACEVAHACWRGDFADDTARMGYIRFAVGAIIESWAESEAEQ